MKITSLKNRFLLFITLIILPMLITSSTLITLRIYSKTKLQQTKQIESIVHIMNKNLENALWNYNHNYVIDFSNSLLLNKDIVMLKIVTDKKNVFQYQDVNLTKISDLDHFQESGYTAIQNQIYKNNIYIGSYQIVFSGKSYKTNLRNQIIYLVLLTVILFVSLTIAISYGVDNFVFRPLNVLGRTMKKISAGEVDVKTPETSDDEIGFLAKSFNEMLDNLKAQFDLEAQLSLQIEESKKSQAVLRSQNKFAQILMDNAPIGLALSKAKMGDFIYLNQSFINICGWPEDKIFDEQEFFELLFNQYQYKSQMIKKIFSAKLSSTKPTIWEDLQICTSEKLEKNITIQRIYIEDRDLVLTTLVDTTKRKIAEKELEEYQQNLKTMIEQRTQELIEQTSKLQDSEAALAYIAEDVNAAYAQLSVANENLSENINDLKTFSYSISHDLRAPLRAIEGFSNIILEDFADQLPEDANIYLKYILTNINNMNLLISDLLQFTRLNSLELRKNSVNLTEIVNSIITNLKISTKEDKIKFIIKSLPKVWGDSSMLKQVLINLISNAIKYSSDQEKQIIEIGTVENSELPNTIYIKDNGIGFDMQFHEKIFEVFKRLHTSDEFEGSGVGLAIVRRLISRHGGKIWAESKLNEGACFFFNIE